MGMRFSFYVDLFTEMFKKDLVTWIYSYIKHNMKSFETANVMLFLILIAATMPLVISHNVSLPGDVRLQTLLAINERSKDGTCSSRIDVTSVMNLEAILWYIENLNANGGLPFKVGKKNGIFVLFICTGIFWCIIII